MHIHTTYVYIAEHVNDKVAKTPALSKKGHQIHKRRRRRKRRTEVRSDKTQMENEKRMPWRNKKQKERFKCTRKTPKREYDGISYVHSHMNLNIALFRRKSGRGRRRQQRRNRKCTTDDVESSKDIKNIVYLLCGIIIWWIWILWCTMQCNFIFMLLAVVNFTSLLLCSTFDLFDFVGCSEVQTRIG